MNANGTEEYAGRSRQEQAALRLARAAWSELGFEWFEHGAEKEPWEYRQALHRQHDPTALMVRFRPDLHCCRHGLLSVLFECKSDDGRHENFALEADSFVAAKMWATGGAQVVYGFVDLAGEWMRCCFAHEIPAPREIRIPTRDECHRTRDRLHGWFPNAALRFEERPRGSGTAYFLIPKTSAFLRPFGAFVRSEILDPKRTTGLAI